MLWPDLSNQTLNIYNFCRSRASTLTTLATQDMAELLDLTATIFNSVYVHRSKDFNHQVRATCIQHLPQYVLFDIKRPLRQEYLKYLGWACSDYEVSVRLAAVRGITQLLEVRKYSAFYCICILPLPTPYPPPPPTTAAATTAHLCCHCSKLLHLLHCSTAAVGGCDRSPPAQLRRALRWSLRGTGCLRC